ncbi:MULTISPECIES: MFS transporter [unclassified Simplicispira]|uniref:MFS transporter n=1 Tax=unclassified Simplicispira TaxID=2630407 RepID=UPI000D5F6CDD|nr:MULTISPECIES: MFS transporter [unclassified Simplicispira]PVY56027.1 putative MFS family arabinose efflux permease [Simplicispira sp. 125]REG16971.1 putative MFS family arabinose efflux permease [Simplicispira sp. 110]
MNQRSSWFFVSVAAAILMITMGSRQSLGLFLSPLNTQTGLGVAKISFAMAIGQLVWGAVQPVFGAVADRWGPGRVIVLGAVLLAAGSAITTQVTSQWGLIFALGILSAAGAGAGSFSILIGATAQHIPAEKRSFASGVINAGGSMGQFVFAPLNQAVMSAFGWMHAMWMMAILALTTAPMAWWLRGSPKQSFASAGGETGLTLREQLRIASRNKSYWCLHAGFFTCGFHIAFLVTHMPGEVNLCGLSANVASTSLAIIGLANVAGSLVAGALGTRVRMKMILFWMYASRVVAILLYMAAPKEPWTFYIFAAVLGATWLATVPPTAGLTAKLFGTRYLATLFGLTLLSHQIGGFFGAWLGGVTVVNTGSYEWMWWTDAALALVAALVNLPIQEERPARGMAFS